MFLVFLFKESLDFFVILIKLILVFARNWSKSELLKSERCL